MRTPTIVTFVGLALVACSSSNSGNEPTNLYDTANISPTDGAGTDHTAETDHTTGTDNTVGTDDTDSSINCPVTPSAYEPGHLFFSGYEEDPWDATWGLSWNQGTNHEITTAGVLFGQNAARVTYPAGTYSSEGGAQYRMAFDQLPSPIPPSDELYVRYYVKFDEGTNFVKGGKLPGLIGGAGNTGGDKPDGFDGFSARLMWRANGRVVQYLYYPDQPGTYGEDLDWNQSGESRFLIPGKWHCLETYLKMNTVNGEGASNAQYDGVVRSWFDGELALEREDIRFRYTNNISIDGFYFSTFFGGGDVSWAPTKTEHAMFDNFVIDNKPIGCLDSCIIPPTAPPGPTPVVAQSTTPVYDGETTLWSTGEWSTADGVKIFDSTDQNHTDGGTSSAYIKFSSSAWDAALFSSSTPFNPSDYTHLRFWLLPAEPGVLFRVQMRGAEDSSDVTVDGATIYHSDPFTVGQWQQVTIPLADFNSVDGQSDLLIRSANNTGAGAFYLDDVELITAQ